MTSPLFPSAAIKTTVEGQRLSQQGDPVITRRLESGSTGIVDESGGSHGERQRRNQRADDDVRAQGNFHVALDRASGPAGGIRVSVSPLGICSALAGGFPVPAASLAGDAAGEAAAGVLLKSRFEIDVAQGSVSLNPASPPPKGTAWPTENPTKSYHAITPTELVVAVHQELRTDPLELQLAAREYSSWLPSALEHEANQRSADARTGMIVGSRFMRLRDYVDVVLAETLRERASSVLADARLAIWEKVAPMSLCIGVGSAPAAVGLCRLSSGSTAGAREMALSD